VGRKGKRPDKEDALNRLIENVLRDFSKARSQHSCPEQFRTCPTIHCALEGLEAIDLTFGLPVAGTNRSSA
jgi:hypothetical protein